METNLPEVQPLESDKRVVQESMIASELHPGNEQLFQMEAAAPRLVDAS